MGTLHSFSRTSYFLKHFSSIFLLFCCSAAAASRLSETFPSENVPRRQFERSAPIMGIIVDHFVDPPCGGQRPASQGQPCNYRHVFLTVAAHSQFHQQRVPSRRCKTAPSLIYVFFCLSICASRPPEDDDGGAFAGVQDSQEVCTTSFSTSPPSQVRTRPPPPPLHFLSFINHITSALRLFFPLHTLSTPVFCRYALLGPSACAL